ncbi:MAG: IS1-like element transposase [bacterium]
MKAGKSTKGIQLYTCQDEDCSTKRFMQKYCYKAYELGIKKPVIDMTINGSGIRDTAHVLRYETLKKRKKHRQHQSKLPER